MSKRQKVLKKLMGAKKFQTGFKVTFSRWTISWQNIDAIAG